MLCIFFFFLIIAISTAKKASEERLKRLQESVDLYKERLGLEIRKIYGKYTNITKISEIIKADYKGVSFLK